MLRTSDQCKCIYLKGDFPFCHFVIKSSETIQRVDATNSSSQIQPTNKKEKWYLVFVSKLEESAGKGN